MLLLLSLIITLLVYGMHFPSIQLSMPVTSTPAEAASQYSSRYDSFIATWGTSVGCHFVELLGIFTGVSIKKVGMHITSCVCHGLGAFLLLCGVFDAWDYRYLMWCFGLFSIAPAIVEFYHMLYFLVFDYNIMKKVEIRV